MVWMDPFEGSTVCRDYLAQGRDSQTRMHAQKTLTSNSVPQQSWQILTYIVMYTARASLSTLMSVNKSSLVSKFKLRSESWRDYAGIQIPGSMHIAGNSRW